MTYRLEFHPAALGEFKALDHGTRERLKEKLRERLSSPHVPASLLRGRRHRYKIKLMRPPIRLVYEVSDTDRTVRVLAVGHRQAIYSAADQRE